jgi:hypothetical protein
LKKLPERYCNLKFPISNFQSAICNIVERLSPLYNHGAALAAADAKGRKAGGEAAPLHFF